MGFCVGDIPFFDEYDFTDNGHQAPHFGLVLLPETSTAIQYKDSVLCSVVTSTIPRSKWLSFFLEKAKYDCFTKDSYICFDRKDLVSKRGLANDPQPRGKLTEQDLKDSFKILKKSLFVVKDLAHKPYLRATIIYEWKVAMGVIKPMV